MLLWEYRHAILSLFSGRYIIICIPSANVIRFLYPSQRTLVHNAAGLRMSFDLLRKFKRTFYLLKQVGEMSTCQ